MLRYRHHSSEGEIKGWATYSGCFGIHLIPGQTWNYERDGYFQTWLAFIMSFFLFNSRDSGFGIRARSRMGTYGVQRRYQKDPEEFRGARSISVCFEHRSFANQFHEPLHHLPFHIRHRRNYN